ncbi:MAG: L-threonate dehydrogenase [Pseudomonadota bacterium]
MSTVGIVGLGAMGLPMALHLRKQGYAVWGCDLNEDATATLKEAGGDVASCPADAAAKCDTLLLMVVNGDQAETVLFGSNGAASTMAEKGGLVIMGCTQPPAQATRTAERLVKQGAAVLDAPVSGGVVGAAGGTLTIMASGPEATFKRATALFEVLGEHIHHVGEDYGQGSAVKMVNQLLAGVHIAVAGEAMALGAAAGIDGQVMFDVFSKSAANSWMFSNRVPRMMEKTPAVASAVDIFVKDLGIVTDHARRSAFPVPLAAAALQQFVAASAMGIGAEDDSAVIKVYERLTGHAPERQAPASKKTSDAS